MSPNDLGKKFIVEECQKLSIRDYIRGFKNNFKEALIKSVLEIAKKPIELTTSKTGFGGFRYWFKCPICQRRIGSLFIHPLSREVGCRECLDLEYRARRFKGMVENFKPF